MATVDYTDAELDAAEREMNAIPRPATEGFVVRRLRQLAEGTGASVEKRLDPLTKNVAALIGRVDKVQQQQSATNCASSQRWNENSRRSKND